MPRKSRKPTNDVPTPPTTPDARDERPVYHAIVVHLLHCAPASYDRAEGELACVVTIGRKSDIEPMVFSMDDSRKLVARLLAAIASSDDKFAQKLLDDNFPADDEGNFHWPAGPEGP